MTAKSKNIIELTDENFKKEVTDTKTPILVDFWATWCPPCKAVAPTVDKLADKYAGKVRVGKVDIDVSPKTAQEFGVQSIPTFLAFKDGKVSGMTIGGVSSTKLEELIKKIV
jgi:thioredoxin 1